jgi:hypothetical protein
MVTFGGFSVQPEFDALDQTWVLEFSSPDDERWIDMGQPLLAPEQGVTIRWSMVRDSKEQSSSVG